MEAGTARSGDESAEFGVEAEELISARWWTEAVIVLVVVCRLDRG